MSRAILVVLALIVSPGTARAEDPGNGPQTSIDARLSDPEEFSSYADVSRRRPAAVLVPGAERAAAAKRPHEGSALIPSVKRERRAPAWIPSPSVRVDMGPSRPFPARTGRRNVVRPVLGLVALAIGILLITERTTRDRPDLPTYAKPPAKPASEETNGPQGSPRPVLSLPVAPLPFFEDEPAPRSPETSWTPAPLPALPWWAITAAEQRAIDRWDRSIEKEFYMLSLDAWLVAHAKDLPDIDVELLNAKIWRDV